MLTASMTFAHYSRTRPSTDTVRHVLGYCSKQHYTHDYRGSEDKRDPQEQHACTTPHMPIVNTNMATTPHGTGAVSVGSGLGSRVGSGIGEGARLVEWT